jgi:hypothetical protein
MKAFFGAAMIYNSPPFFFTSDTIIPVRLQQKKSFGKIQHFFDRRLESPGRHRYPPEKMKRKLICEFFLWFWHFYRESFFKVWSPMK